MRVGDKWVAERSWYRAGEPGPVTRWRARAAVGTPLGTREVERVASTREGALEALRDAVTDAGAPVTTGRTLSPYLDLLLASKAEVERSSGTLRTYRSVIERTLRPRLGAALLVALTPALIRGELKDLGKGSAATARTVLKQALDLAVAEGAIDRNPAAALAPAARKQARPNDAPPVLDDRQWALLLELVRAYDARPRTMGVLADVLLLSAALGARPGELFAFRVTDLDKSRRFVSITGTMTPKGRQDFPKTPSGWRTVEIPVWADDLIARLIAGKGPEDLLLRARTERLLARNVHRSLDKALAGSELDGLPGVDLKAGRRRVLNELAGHDKAAAAAQAGHSSTAPVSSYTNARPVSREGARILDPDAKAKTAAGRKLVRALEAAGYEMAASPVFTSWAPVISLIENDEREAAEAIVAAHTHGQLVPSVIWTPAELREF